MRPTARSRRRRDPRNEASLPARDYEALRYISAWYQVEQYQLEAALFADRSPTVVSRCIRRLAAAGYVIVERWNRVGINLLRTTARGRRALIARGVDDSTIFVPEKTVALKDLAHQLWVVDTGLALRRVSAKLEIAPCWSLRRKLAALKPAAIPDLLALRRGASGDTDAAVAVEVGPRRRASEERVRAEARAPSRYLGWMGWRAASGDSRPHRGFAPHRSAQRCTQHAAAPSTGLRISASTCDGSSGACGASRDIRAHLHLAVSRRQRLVREQRHATPLTRARHAGIIREERTSRCEIEITFHNGVLPPYPQTPQGPNPS